MRIFNLEEGETHVSASLQSIPMAEIEDNVHAGYLAGGHRGGGWRMGMGFLTVGLCLNGNVAAHETDAESGWVGWMLCVGEGDWMC